MRNHAVGAKVMSTPMRLEDEVRPALGSRMANGEPVRYSTRPVGLEESNVTLHKIMLVGGTAALLNILAAPALAEGCKEPKTGTNDVPIFSPPLANVVTGAGRLQFYSAPSERCAISGVFIIPKDELVAYAETDDGWSQVMYMNPRTGNTVSGWVRSARLKQTGTMGPKQ
jgi:hypothetical protein